MGWGKTAGGVEYFLKAQKLEVGFNPTRINLAVALMLDYYPLKVLLNGNHKQITSPLILFQ